MPISISNLEQEMRESLQLIHSGLIHSGLDHSGNDQLTVAVRSLQVITAIIGRLRGELRAHPFPGLKEEIHHFKKEAPLFYSRQFYFQKVLQTELHRIHTSRQGMEAFLEKERAAIDDFYHRHEDFCRLYHLEDTSIDHRLYIRNEAENPRQDEIEKIMDSDYCVGAYYAARLLANKGLRVYLEKQLQAIRSVPT
jgi:hypothetical protein